ncbi:MAG: hypothetical protein J6Z22_05145 [Lachnospiraceae bacterium]|nr:hypothetical protein [Lachnospiraceae bacterium]
MLQGLNTIFFLVFLGMIGMMIARKDVEGKQGIDNEIKGEIKPKLSEKTVFILLMLLALALRLWQFGIVPGGMNQDGAMAAVDAKALADYGTDRLGMFMPTHFTAWGFAQMNVFMSYCMVPFFKLFGMNVVTTRLPVLIFSMLGLVALYFTGKMLHDIRGAQIILAFAVCNPWHFMQSRWALESNMLPHVFMIGFCFLLMGMKWKKIWLYLSMVFFAMCMYCYGIAFYTVSVFLIIMAVYLCVKKLVKWQEILISALIYALFSWPIYMTMAINAFGWKTMRTFFCTMPYFKDSVRSKDILFFGDNIGEQFLKNLAAVRRVYLEGDGLPWNTMEGIGVMTTCFLPFVFLGIVACVKRIKEEENNVSKAQQIALIVAFCVANLSGLITAEVNVNRINILHYSLLILAGYGIVFMIQRINRAKYIILACYLVISAWFLGDYFTEHAKTLERYYYHDFLEAVRYAGDSDVSGCTRFVITPDTQYTGSKTVSEILTMFALDVDAK